MITWQRSPELGSLGVPEGPRYPLDALEREVAEYFERGAVVRPDDVVFDVGANIGAFAVEAARRADGPIRLHAFEPAPPLFPALCANAAHHPSLGRSECRLAPVAVGDGSRGPEAELSYFRRIPTDSTCDMEGKRRDFERFFAAKARRVEAAARPYVGTHLARLVRRLVAALPAGTLGRRVSDRVLGRRVYRCPTTTLSDVIRTRGLPRIDLLKIDVEGAELEVLRGVAPEHWPRVQQVVLEGHDEDGRLEEVAAILRDAGFRHYAFGATEGGAKTGIATFLAVARRDL